MRGKLPADMSIFSTLLVLLAISGVYSNGSSKCDQKEVSTSYIDTAVDALVKAKYFISTRLACESFRDEKPVDCAEILHMGFNRSGVYKIWPMNRLTENKPFDVYCDMETDGGGWTLIQRRGNFQRPKDYFYKDWKSYKEGFGDIRQDFWLGNDYIYALTNQKVYSARFDLQDVQLVKRYAQYDTFRIDDEEQKYKLHIADYRGDAGDSMTITGGNNHNNQKFSTKDQKNNNHKDDCALLYKGAWWYNGCHASNLNALYHRGKHDSHADGVNWFSWKGYNESLESTEIKIRPKDFRFPNCSSNDHM